MHVDLDTGEQLGETAMFNDGRSDEIIALDAVLRKMAERNGDGAQIVEYRFLGELQFKEIAEVRGVSG
jgi:hypothetical protein